MFRASMIAAAVLALSVAPAAGAEDKGAPKEIGQYVDLAPVALPVVVRGQLVNYVFVSVRIILASSANAGKLRSREPYFRDALVRAGHRTPFTRPDDYLSLDTAKLKAALYREAATLTDPRDIQSIVVVSQAPKTRTGIPTPAKGPAATQTRR